MFEICSLKDQKDPSMPFPTSVKLSKRASSNLTGEERNLPHSLFGSQFPVEMTLINSEKGEQILTQQMWN